MQITVNKQIQEFTFSPTISQLMENLFPLGYTKGIAIAINQQVISKEEWQNYVLKENDRVTVIKATQGG